MLAERIAFQALLVIVPQVPLRKILPLLAWAQMKQTHLMGVVRDDGRDLHDVRVVSYSLNFSLARAGSFPADVPLTFSNKNGLLMSKCNKEKLTDMKIFCDGKRMKMPCLDLTLHKQRQRGSKTVQEAFFTDRPNLAIAKETGKTERAKLLLRQAGIVIRHAKEIFSASIAAAQASAINSRAMRILLGTFKKLTHVLARRISIAPLKLHGLAGPGHCANGKNAGIRVATNKLAHQEIAAMKILKILIHNQADKQVATGLLLVSRRKLLERLGQHGVRRAVGDLMD